MTEVRARFNRAGSRPAASPARPRTRPAV